MNILPLILARGGSKGLPRKNIKSFNGKPLLSYVLIEALNVFPRVYISTEDFEIKEIAKEYGGLVIDRPPELATDEAKSIDAVKHALMVHDANAVCLLNACAPFTTAKDIQNSLELFAEADSVTSLVEDFSSHPSKVCYLHDSKIIPIGNFSTGERQLQERIYKRNTAIYIAKKEVIESGTFFGKNCKGYVMPKERSFDINDSIDFLICSLIYETIRKQSAD